MSVTLGPLSANELVSADEPLSVKQLNAQAQPAGPAAQARLAPEDASRTVDEQLAAPNSNATSFRAAWQELVGGEQPESGALSELHIPGSDSGCARDSRVSDSDPGWMMGKAIGTSAKTGSSSLPGKPNAKAAATQSGRVGICGGFGVGRTPASRDVFSAAKLKTPTEALSSSRSASGKGANKTAVHAASSSGTSKTVAQQAAQAIALSQTPPTQTSAPIPQVQISHDRDSIRSAYQPAGEQTTAYPAVSVSHASGHQTLHSPVDGMQAEPRMSGIGGDGYAQDEAAGQESSALARDTAPGSREEEQAVTIPSNTLSREGNSVQIPPLSTEPLASSDAIRTGASPDPHPAAPATKHSGELAGSSKAQPSQGHTSSHTSQDLVSNSGTAGVASPHARLESPAHEAVRVSAPQDGAAASMSYPGVPLRAQAVSETARPQTGQVGERDVFRSLDGENGMPAGAWIHTSPHRAEAGYLDPALGWVGVRADASNGAVHASLLSSSAQSAQFLGSHLQGLNSYLNDRQPQPTTVALGGSESGAGTMTSDSGADQQQSEGGRRSEAESSLTAASFVERAGSNTAAGPLSRIAFSSGGRISVVA